MVFVGTSSRDPADRSIAPTSWRVCPRRDVRQQGPRTLIATVSEPDPESRIVEAMRTSGVGTVGMEEHQPTFDEVFTGLVEQRRALRDSNGDGNGTDRDG